VRKIWLLGILLASQAPGDTEHENTVRGVMQPMPGEEAALIDAKVHQTPTNLPLVPANLVNIGDRELVLGLVHEGKPYAFPIRYLGRYEVINQQLGDLPVTATW